MIDKSFIREIVDNSAPTIVSINGLDYTDKDLSPVIPPIPTVLTVQYLDSLVAYCLERLEPERRYIIHVEKPSRVVLRGDLDPKVRVRESYLVAEAFTSDFEFGVFMPNEQFIIALQSEFVQDEQVADILKVVGNLETGSTVGTKDDGVSQVVEARVALAKTANVTLPNQIPLRPYRTFIEVEQPVSKFVLRIHADHRCALFLADGGLWQIDAAKKVAKYIENALKSVGADIERITILA